VLVPDDVLEPMCGHGSASFVVVECVVVGGVVVVPEVAAFVIAAPPPARAPTPATVASTFTGVFTGMNLLSRRGRGPLNRPRV